MRVTGVRVEISKTVSDGHYGNERYNAQYIAELDEDEDPDDAIRLLSERGRANIIGQLAESESASIRFAIAPPTNLDACTSCGAVVTLTAKGLCEDCADADEDVNF